MLLEAPGNNMDAFVFRMSSDGNVIWSRAFWSAGNDILHSLDEGPNGEIYLQVHSAWILPHLVDLIQEEAIALCPKVEQIFSLPNYPPMVL